MAMCDVYVQVVGSEYIVIRLSVCQLDLHCIIWCTCFLTVVSSRQYIIIS